MEIIENKIISDKNLHIAVGSSRNSKRWKNEEVTWSEFVKRLYKTIYTSETVKEYHSMSRDKKTQIKDVGGYVGGFSKDGTRSKYSIQNRSFIALDLDHVDISVDDIWNNITMLYDVEFVMHSSHSHTSDSPRLRLIFPTDRFMLSEEYQAVSRKVAENIGKKFFDKTTFEPNRLMFWPSTPSDGEYEFRHNGGNFLKVDDILNSYDNWKDMSEWPVFGDDDLLNDRPSKKIEDPTTKNGIIGAFCRTYSISEAIDEFLSDVYEASTIPNRYTFKGGTTSNGAVVYDDKFLYSHHESDPISGKEVNSFDLVRLHLFGDLDSEAKKGTPVNRLPSYTAMSQFASEDKKVKKLVVTENLKMAEEDFEFNDSDDSSDNYDWIDELALKKNGEPVETRDNILIIMQNDPKLKNKLIYDEFSNRPIVLEGAPWTKEVKHDYNDTDDSGLRTYIEKIWKISNNNKIDDAKNLILEQNKFHPIRDYLNDLKWDGVKRLETVFVDYLGSEDSLYTRSVAKIQFVGAVARVMRPGIKFDTMVTLAGPQGIGKSTFISKVSKGHYSDSMETLKGKEAGELLQGVWHLEFGELNAFRKSDRDQFKAFLSRQEDRYRVAYQKNTSRFPRQCVFWGTTNDIDFLRDPTGDRRTYPIDCWKVTPTKSIFEDLDEEIDQIWAEAMELWKNGEPLYLKGEALNLAKQKQEQHKEDTPLKGLIEDYLNRRYPDNWEEMDEVARRNFIKAGEASLDFPDTINLTVTKDKVCVLEVWVEVLGNSPGSLKKSDSREINDILRSIDGWEKTDSSLRFGRYGTQRGYVRV